MNADQQNAVFIQIQTQIIVHSSIKRHSYFPAKVDL